MLRCSLLPIYEIEVHMTTVNAFLILSDYAPGNPMNRLECVSFLRWFINSFVSSVHLVISCCDRIMVSVLGLWYRRKQELCNYNQAEVKSNSLKVILQVLGRKKNRVEPMNVL